MMYPCKVIRSLRIKYKITTREMSAAIGVSQPRYMEIELSEGVETPHLQDKVAKGLGNIVRQREEGLTSLKADFEKYKYILLERNGILK